MRSMSARSIAFGVWFCGDQGTSETERIGQLPEASGRLSSTQPSSVEPLGPEWPSWRQILASVSAWTKSTMRFQAASASGAVGAGAAGGDAALGGDAGHLGVDEAGAALGALAEVDEVPVGRDAVHGLVLGHRRDDDAVLELEAAQAEGGEHRAADRRRSSRRRRGAGTSARRRPASRGRAGGGSRG